MVYVAGHGIWENRQNYVLNVDEEVNMLGIELKLRAIAASSNTNVVAFFDSCRSEKYNFAYLKVRKEARGPEDELSIAEHYQYVDIGTNPGKTVPGESNLAYLIAKRLNQKSGENAAGLVTIPDCLAGIGEKRDNGSAYCI